MPDSRFKIVNDKILAKLAALTKLNEVVDYPKLEFEKYPAAYFAPAESESSWADNTLDERSYPFEILIFYDTKAVRIAEAKNALFDCVDDVLDTFAQDRQLSDTGTALQASLTANGYTNDTMITVEPVNVSWEQITDQNLIYAKVSIKVRIAVSNQ